VKEAILITGSSSEFGAMAAWTPALTCHTACASMRNLAANEGKPVVEIVNDVADHARVQLTERPGLADLLHPAARNARA
jgi:hypothetical protein